MVWGLLMMLEKYRFATRAISNETAALVMHKLRISRWFETDEDKLFNALNQHGFDQAALVLCLLRINTQAALHHVEALVGKPIEYCKPVYHWQAVPVNRAELPGDHRRVLRVAEQPELKSGRRSWLRRYHLLKVGLSVEQLLRRGVTRNDIRLLIKRGWILLEGSVVVPRTHAPRAGRTRK